MRCLYRLDRGFFQLHFDGGVYASPVLDFLVGAGWQLSQWK
jgi:hypothetical protein